MQQLTPDDPYIYFSQFKAFRMDTRTGSYAPFLEIGGAQLGTTPDTLWSMGFDISSGGLQFAFLPKLQSDWQIFTTNVELARYIKWRYIDRYVIGIFYGRDLAVFNLDLKKNSFNIKSLADNNITSIRDVAYFNGRVYLATTRGLISKPLKDFVQSIK